MRTPIILIMMATFITGCDASIDFSTDDNVDQIAGAASVVDGDTIEIHGERIRLDGFDTPERGSLCGSVNVYKEAAFALSGIVKGTELEAPLLGV
jgi:endonuclease YncB( thermonuclease family)